MNEEPKLPQDSELKTAYDALRTGNFHHAKKICDDVLFGNPGNPVALYITGLIAMQVGHLSVAERKLRDSLLSDSNVYHTRIALARVLFRLGKYRESSAICRDIANTYPGQRDPLDLLGMATSEIDRIDRKISDINERRVAPAMRLSGEGAETGLDVREVNFAASLFRYYGYLVLENVFSGSVIDSLYSEFCDDYRSYFEDRQFDNALQVGNKRTMITLAMRGQFNNSEIYANPFMLKVLQRLLGDDCILASLGAVLSRPGAADQHIHRDGPSLFGCDLDPGIAPSFCVTAGVPLIEMNNEHGTTRFFNRSHKDLDYGFRDKENDARSPVVTKGSCVLFDYLVWHNGTANRSNTARPLVYYVYGRPWYRDFNNYGLQKPLDLSEEDFSQVPEEFRFLMNWTQYAG